MDAQSVRTALGTLQSNSDSLEAWETLRSGLSDTEGDLDAGQAERLLVSARKRHASRGEAEAVKRLLDLSIQIVPAEERAALYVEQARVLLEDLYEGAAAQQALRTAIELGGGEEATTALDELESKAARALEQIATYTAEADGATDDAYQSAMIMRAAEVEVTFSREPRWTSLVENLERAVRLDPSNLLAAKLLEVVYRRQNRFEDVARVLGRVLERAPDVGARIAAGVRLGRLSAHTLNDEARAAAAYDRVLESDPSQPDAMEFVTDYYAQKDRWDDLVRVYERPLKGVQLDASKLGDMLQVAMLHWRKREVPADAEPWFAKIRKLDPTHDGVLNFYREYKTVLEDDAGLVQVLQEAQRALPDGDARAAEIATELARFAESQANAHRAIEQYKSVLRADPENVEARTQLKSLYKQTQGHNALVELLRQDLERTPETDLEKRLATLREIAMVYREYFKSETALVGVLNQIVQLDGKLDEHDVGEVRELVGLYERLGRHRDLLASKKLLAEIVPDRDEKRALYRQIGRLWLDQFSNVQHAMEAYAALHEVDPSDQEAIERLDELYRKRRAWKELYVLYEEQLASKEGGARVPILREMAQLAAERLGKVDDALVLYQQILDIDPTRLDVLDKMEKFAERAKNWPILADALEKRLALTPEDETRLPVLQKLGSVYADQLEDAEKAIGTWRRVVDAQPGNPRAMRVLRDTYLKGDRFDELEDLYQSQGDLEGLAEVLSTAADRAQDAAIKIDLSYRAARVYEDRLGQAARAIRSYERILSLDSKDARAIERLLPLYEQEEKWARVPALLEALVELSPSPEDKVSVFSRLVDVTGQKLADRRAAAAHARRAYELAPHDPRAAELLDAACRSAGVWDEMVQALEARLGTLGGSVVGNGKSSSEAPPAFTEPVAEAPSSGGKKKKGRGRRNSGGGAEAAPAAAAPVEAAAPTAAVADEPEDPSTRLERRNVSLRLARVLGEELGQIDAAMKRLEALADEHPNDPEILGAVETLLARDNRPNDVRWLHDHRARHAVDADTRADHLADWAAYEEFTMEDAARALTLQRQALEASPDRVQSLEAVARLALANGLPDVAAQALERHRDLSSGGDRALKESILAELYAERLGRPVDALRAAERALADGVEPGLVIPVLSRLVDVAEVRGEAARILSEQYEQGGNARQEADALRALVSETSDPDEQVALYERLASVYEDKLTEPGGALGVVLEVARKFPARTELWDRADTLSRVAGRPTALAEAYRDALRTKLEPEQVSELSRRAAELHQIVLGDPAGAVPYLERLLAVEPDDEPAFNRLKEILTAAERWRELEELYDREIQRLEDDHRRMEMLAEVALLAEDIMGDGARAVTYHVRILELDPVSSIALESLDRLYTRLSRREELADLLDKRAEQALGEEQAHFYVRIAQLALSLHQPERSAAAVERVLEADPGSYEARDVAEELLKIGGVRIRAARALESVYEARDEIRDLVRVLGVRVEGLRPNADEPVDSNLAQEREDERRDLLRRIATLRNDRLHDDEGSFDVFAELSPLDPLDSDLRARLIDSGRRLGRNETVVGVLKSAAQAADSAAVRGEILMQAATIQREILDDSPAAEITYGEIIALRGDEPELSLEAARALESLLATGSRNEELSQNLRLQIELETDFDRKRALLARLAHLSSEVLGDKAAAIAAWEARLEESSDDPEALLALTDLYEQSGRYSDLARVVQERRDAATKDADRVLLTRKLAEIQEQHLDQTVLSIESYQTVLDEVGPDVEVLAALARLYGKAERYLELSEIYEKQADVLELESERLSALVALGRIRAEKLEDLPGALDTYRRALSVDMNQAEARAALLKLLAHEDTVTRLEAAEILQPIFEADGNHERLLTVLEVQANSNDDASVQIERLSSAVRVAEEALHDAGRALGYALRGTKLAAEQGDVSDWLPVLERLAARADARSAQVELLERIAPELFDAEQQLLVQKRVGSLYRDELQDLDRAVAAYEKAAEARPDDREALSALEELFTRTKQPKSLMQILERREEAAESDSERKGLLFQRARLFAGELAEPGRAIETYEALLDIELDPTAIAEVSALYTKQERFEDLTQLIQRRIDEGESGRVALRVELARVLADNVGDLDRGLDELGEALSEDGQNAGAIELLERLSRGDVEAAKKGRIAALLEPVYMVRADYDRVLHALELRLAGSEDPTERRELITRLAQIHEEQREDYRAALEVNALLLAEDAEDPLTVGEMERLAKVAGAEVRLAELFAAQIGDVEPETDATFALRRRAGEIFAANRRPKEALVLLQKALEFAPESDDLFETVDRVLVEVGTDEQRVEHYRKGLEHRFEPEDRVRFLQVIAELEEKKLGHVDEAILAHREVLETEEQNVTSLEALARLYEKTKRYEDLAELYQRRAEALDPTQAAPFRLALAVLLENELGRPEAALDQLEEIVRDLPTHVDAITRIEAMRGNDALKERAVEILRPLYESADDWKRMIKLNEDRFQLAPDPHERVAILRETAQLWEYRGGEPARARRVVAEAFKLVPEEEDTRLELERLVEITTEWSFLAGIYAAVLIEHPDLANRRDVLSRLAELEDEKLDDPRAALSSYRELVKLDSSDLGAVVAIERLATLLADWRSLEEALVAHADMVFDDEERRDVLIRLGSLRHLTLDDSVGAIEAYERAWEVDPSRVDVCDWLISLYESGDDAGRLVELYLARVDLTEEDDARYEFLIRAAALFEKKLSDRPRAIETLSRALEARPGDAAAIAELNRLYREEEMWSELLDNLRLDASTAETEERRLEVRHEMASILSEKLESYEEALEAYGIILHEKPDDVPALDAVFALAEREEHLRQQAAELLVPALRQTEHKTRLVKALELRLSIESEPEVRARTLQDVAEVEETRLGDTKKAFEALLRAFQETPESTEIVASVERLAEPTRGWARFADVLQAKAEECFEPELARDLWVRLAEVREVRLGQKKEAISAYQKATEQVGDRLDLLEALDRLYTETGDTAAVIDLLERRMVLADSDEAQSRLLTRQGQLQLDEQKSPNEALSSLRQALERDVRNEEASRLLSRLLDQKELFDEVFDVLDGVYRDRPAPALLAELHERRVKQASTPGERIDMRRALARVLEEEGADPASAQRVLLEGLRDDPADSGLIDEIERLLPITRGYADAARAVLATLDELRQIEPETGRELAQKAAGWLRDQVADATGAEAALLRAHGYAPDADEVLEQIEALQGAPGREADLLVTTSKRAALALDDGSKIDFLRRAKSLADKLERRDEAEQYLRQILAIDDADLEALEGLTFLRRAAGDDAATFDLLVKRAEIEADGDKVRVLRFEAAELARDKLKRLPAAIDLLEALFDDDPNDERVARGLRQAYEADGRWEDLSRLVERLMDGTSDPVQVRELQVALARLHRGHLKDDARAIELLEEVVSVDPGHEEASGLLAEIYEKEGRFDDLTQLFERLRKHAEDTNQIEKALVLLRRLAALYEGTLQEPGLAVATWRSIQAKDDGLEPLEALLRLETARGNQEEAAEILAQLSTRSTGEAAIERRLELVELRRQLGQTDALLQTLADAVALAPAHPGLRDRLRKEYEAASRFDKVADLLVEDADQTEAKKDKVNLLRQAATIHWKKRQDPEAAAALLGRAAALVPEDRELSLELCDAYSESGRGAEAVAVLQQIVDSFGGRRAKELADIHRRLATAYLSQKQPEKAVEELDKAFRIEPGNIAILKQLGEVALEMNDLKKAMQMFRALLLQRIDDSPIITKTEVFYRIGQVHQLQGEPPKAKQMYERALQSDPNYAPAKEAMASLG